LFRGSVERLQGLAAREVTHVSEFAEGRTEKVEIIVTKGEVITVKRLGVDEKDRVKMSRRAWLRDQKAEQAEAAGTLADSRSI
jgi:predicted RNA-binding protein with RPS1 domain